MTHPTLCVGGPLNGQVVERRGVTHYGCAPDNAREQYLYRLQKISEHLGDPHARAWLMFVWGHVPACDAVALAIKLNLQPLGNPYAIAD